ncbi:hypothetical protein GCM10007977_110270 [Dactylosporangium sucinum]|uniref:Uncharacterized protein n=1 Tax=Dactylosporangium sucinum TaxID=1424081 RepID=A0A917UG15_9ACTN|nr:hypothetical protein GCM10007977_110270 [Dactylosporangium sucinum]
MPSRWWLWNAWETFSSFALRPSMSAVTASASPDTTTEVGPFTAARPTRPSTRYGRISSSDATTDAINPPEGADAINRPRAATILHAPSRSQTPARYAAVNSPIECPPNHRGRNPQASNCR